MKCPKCGSENVNVQVVSETKLKKKHHPIYWLLVGWWLQPVLWLFLALPMLIIAIFKPKSYVTKTTHKSMCVCQSCGHTWTV